MDHMLATYRLAQERRAAGRPVWDRTVNIKRFINTDPDNISDEHCVKVANEIAAELRAKLPAKLIADDFELEDIVETLEQLRPDSYADDPSFSAVQDLNNTLELLYDWADLNRVWLG
jgi:hypothetical protein